MKHQKTNRILALVLVLISVVTCFSGCGKKGSKMEKKGSVQVPKTFADKKMEPYIRLILSENYTYETTPKIESKDTPVTYAKAGQKSMVTIRVQDMPITYMYVDGVYYIVMGQEYTQATPEQIQKLKIKELITTTSLDQFAQATFVKSGKTKVEGQDYTFEDYYNTLTQVTNRFFFDENDKLALLARVNGEGEISSITPIKLYETNPATFEVLKTYKYVKQEEAPAETTEAPADKK